MGPEFSESDTPYFLPECVEKHQGNLLQVPDLSTLHPVPWANKGKYKVGAVLCETKWMPDYTPHVVCPRYLAQMQLDRLHKMGYSCLMGFENEFTLFRKGTKIPGNPSFDDLVTETTAQYEEYIFEVDDVLQQAGINLDVAHLEGWPGCVELIFQPEYGIKACDNTFMVKEAVKELAGKYGYDASFMGRPTLNTGSTKHFNHSLWDIDRKRNIFYETANNNKSDKTSDVFRHWMGGLLKHAEALTAICCPLVNDYRLLHSYWSAHLINWGLDDRDTCYR